MELPSINSVTRLRRRIGESLHRRAAGTVSILAHLAVIGALWASPYRKLLDFRLAGDRGSIALQASLDRPTPAEQPVVERLSPVQVRVEPDHQHVDQFVFALALQARVGELEELVFQWTDRRVLHPQYQPYFNAFGNL